MMGHMVAIFKILYCVQEAFIVCYSPLWQSFVSSDEVAKCIQFVQLPLYCTCCVLTS